MLNYRLMLKPILLLFFLNVVSICPLFSQGTIVLNTIEESRFIDAHKNILKLKMEAKDFKTDSRHFLRVKKIDQVSDDTGQILSPHNRYPYKGSWNTRRFFNFNFYAPTRAATKLTELSAVIEYFTISQEKKSLLQVNNIGQKTIRNLLSAISNNEKLILLDYEKLKAVKDQPEFEDYVKKLHKAGIGTSIEDTKEFITRVFYFSYKDVNSQLIFYKKDPDEKVFKINVYNDNGEKINTGYSYSDEKIVIHLSETITANASLEVMFEHPDAIEQTQLKLQNIPLP